MIECAIIAIALDEAALVPSSRRAVVKCSWSR